MDPSPYYEAERLDNENSELLARIAKLEAALDDESDAKDAALSMLEVAEAALAGKRGRA